MSFSSLGLDPSLLDNLTRLGYATPTPVQREAIPAVLAGGDLLVSSQTGSGNSMVLDWKRNWRFREISSRISRTGEPA